MSGIVSGAASQGVTVSLSGASSATTTTDTTGHFAFAGLADGSYVVTPSLSNYAFTPPIRSVTLSGADVSGQDFTASVAQSVVCDGDVTITNADEYADFFDRGCTSVTGTLSISGTTLTSVSLPKLTTVLLLRVSNNAALNSVSLPALVATTNWPELPGAGPSWYLQFHDNPALTNVSLPALTKSTIRAFNSLSLTSLSLPLLARGSVNIGDTGLASLSLPALTAGSLIVSGNGLASLSLPALTSGSVYVQGTGLTGLSLPVLTSASDLRIQQNPVLVRVSAPALTEVTFFFIVTGNTSYPQCAAEALLAQLTAVPAYSVDISGNDTTATCP